MSGGGMQYLDPFVTILGVVVIMAIIGFCVGALLSGVVHLISSLAG